LQKVIEQIKTLFQSCLDLQTDLQNKIAQTVETSNQQLKLSEDLRKQQTNLSEREAKITEIEDVIQYRKDADLRMEQAQATIDDYHKRVTNFTAYEDSTKKELTSRKELLDKREEALNKKEANLEALILEKVKSALKG
jgi:esterase/lipase